MMATGQISQYFSKAEGSKMNKTLDKKDKSTEKKDNEQKGDQNPNKRTRSELSSIDSETSETVNIQILEELKSMNERLKDTVKTGGTEYDRKRNSNGIGTGSEGRNEQKN